MERVLCGMSKSMRCPDLPAERSKAGMPCVQHPFFGHHRVACSTRRRAYPRVVASAPSGTPDSCGGVGGEAEQDGRRQARPPWEQIGDHVRPKRTGRHLTILEGRRRSNKARLGNHPAGSCRTATSTRPETGAPGCRGSSTCSRRRDTHPAEHAPRHRRYGARAPASSIRS